MKPRYVAFRILEFDEFEAGTCVKIDAWDNPDGIWVRMDKGVFMDELPSSKHKNKVQPDLSDPIIYENMELLLKAMGGKDGKSSL